MGHPRAVLLGLVVSVGLVGVPEAVAHAAWAARSATTSVATQAVVVPAPGTVELSKSTLLGLLAPTYTVTWTAVPATYGTGTIPVTNWYVERFRNGSATPDGTASDCNLRVVATTSCTETLTLLNSSTTFQYRVTPQLSGWRGVPATSPSR